MTRALTRSTETTSPSADDMIVQRIRMPRSLLEAGRVAAEACGETYTDFVIRVQTEAVRQIAPNTFARKRLEGRAA